MKSIILAATCLSLAACVTVKNGALEARHAALALSACQPLGAEPRYISSQSIGDGDYRVSVYCTSDIDIAFTVKKPAKKVEDI